MRSVSHHSSFSEGCDLNKKFDESYLCDQTTFSKGITTPAAMEALNVAKCFISYYRLPLHLIKFAWMEHPKGTVIVDGNGNAIMNEHSSDSKKLPLLQEWLSPSRMLSGHTNKIHQTSCSSHNLQKVRNDVKHFS